jgi:transposase
MQNTLIDKNRVHRSNAERNGMRGRVDPQGHVFVYLSPESRVPADHPLRSIKLQTGRVLKELSNEFEALYATTGRPSIPPEQLLKGQLMMALYSVRSDRQFCQMLDYNILFRWFLDMCLEDAGLDQSNFSRPRERLMTEDLAQRFFDAIVKVAWEEDLLSDAIDQLMDDPESARRLGATGRQKILSKYHLGRNVEGLAQEFRKRVAERPAATE